MQRLTIEDIKSMTKEFLTPAEAAAVIGMDPHYIRIAARTHPEYLHFPCVISGNRTHIPRRAFINFVEFGISQ